MRSSDVSEQQVRPVFAALASPPDFNLPPATLGHTRHYMRWYKKGPQDQTLVFDAFVCVARDSDVLVSWPRADLDSQQRALLARLLDQLGYLGRAESWCEARLIDRKASMEGVNSRPLDHGQVPASNEELVRVLCPDPDTAFLNEHVRATSGRKRPVYDPEWNLAIETAQLHAEKWSDPPGSRWVTYVRPSDCFHVRTEAFRPRPPRLPMQVARYALDSTVLPLATATLPVAERARSALMARMPRDGDQRRPSRIFSGKDVEGRPLVGHGHAYFLPTDEDGDGRLDHLTIFAKDGFGEGEARAIDHLRVLRPRGDEPEIRLLLLGIAQENQFQVPPLGPAETWVSATPFIATRHPKKNGLRRDPPELLQDSEKFVAATLEEELERLNQRWGLPIPDVEPILDEAGAFRICPSRWKEGATGPQRRAIEFKRFRSRKSPDDGGRRRSGFFKLHFPEPVRGPISIGHSAHFGMGLFLPEAKTVR